MKTVQNDKGMSQLLRDVVGSINVHIFADVGPKGKALDPVGGIPANQKVYQLGTQRPGKLWGAFLEIIILVSNSQEQALHGVDNWHRLDRFSLSGGTLLRTFGSLLNSTPNFSPGAYGNDFTLLTQHSALETFNNSLMTDVEAHYRDPTKPYPGVSHHC